MGIEREMPRDLRSFFWVCYFHEVGLSRKKPGYSKVNIRRKKDLMQHGKCVLHKVLNSYFFLGSQRMPNFALLTGLEDAEISQKQFLSQGKSNYSPKGKIPRSPPFFHFPSFFASLPVPFSFSCPSVSFLSIHGIGQHPMTNKAKQK